MKTTRKITTILLLIFTISLAAQADIHRRGAKFRNAVQRTTVEKIPLMRFNNNKLNFYITPEDFITDLDLVTSSSLTPPTLESVLSIGNTSVLDAKFIKVLSDEESTTIDSLMVSGTYLKLNSTSSGFSNGSYELRADRSIQSYEGGGAIRETYQTPGTISLSQRFNNIKNGIDCGNGIFSFSKVDYNLGFSHNVNLKLQDSDVTQNFNKTLFLPTSNPFSNDTLVVKSDLNNIDFTPQFTNYGLSFDEEGNLIIQNGQVQLYFNGSGINYSGNTFNINSLNGLFVDNNIETTNGTIRGNDFKVSGLNTPPSSSSDIGQPGDIRYTADYIYLCVSPNNWKRSSLTTW